MGGTTGPARAPTLPCMHNCPKKSHCHKKSLSQALRLKGLTGPSFIVYHPVGYS